MKTQEELIEQFNNFYFIDVYTGERHQDRVLKDITEEKDEEVRNNNTYGWYWEEIEYGKLMTIVKWEMMREGWYRDRYYKQITSPESRRDVKVEEGGMIEGIGIAMNIEEFELYKNVKNKLFKHGKVETSI